MTLTYFTPENLHSEASFLAETAEKAKAVFESVARDLARRAVKFLVVELYCKEGSALKSVCQKEDVPYVGISPKIDLFNEETQEFLSEVFSVLNLRTRVCDCMCTFLLRVRPVVVFAFSELAQARLQEEVAKAIG